MSNEIGELSTDELESVSGGGFAGIDALIAVTQMKVDNAKNNAMAGAQAQALFRHCASGSHIPEVKLAL
jgi:hypothetical protein